MWEKHAFKEDHLESLCSVAGVFSGRTVRNDEIERDRTRKAHN